MVFMGAQQSWAQNPTPTPPGTPISESNTIEGRTVITKTLPFDKKYPQRLTLPEGFTVNNSHRISAMSA